MAALTEDFVIEILSRLPVKSLLRFKCLSKSWCATIETRGFRYKHLKNTTDESRGSLWVQYFFDYSRSFLNAFFPDETLVDSTHLPFDVPLSWGRVILHSPCNGIFLVSNTEGVFALWNPATKEFRDLPDPGFARRGCYEECGGFGLDPITNDYKVVVLQYSEDIDYTLGMVHTLGTDYWKDLGTDLDGDILILDRTTCCTYLNGFYYFLGSHARVISFDMGTDALQVIPQPNEIQLPMGQWPDQNLHLAVYQDRIALFKLGYQDYHLNVWLLEEGSWIKHLSVGPLTGMVYPVGCWNNEELLLHSETYELLLCKLTTLEIRHLGLQGSYDCLGINKYRESLISIEDLYKHRHERR